MMLRRVLRNVGPGKFFLLFMVTLLFGLGERMGVRSTMPLHLLAVLNDQYYFMFCVLPVFLFFCTGVMEDDTLPALVRYESYSRYFFHKWRAVSVSASMLWLGHFCSRSLAVKLLLALYLFAVLWIKLPVMSRPPFVYLTGWNHWVLLLHDLAQPWRLPDLLLLFCCSLPVYCPCPGFRWVFPVWHGLTCRRRVEQCRRCLQLHYWLLFALPFGSGFTAGASGGYMIVKEMCIYGSYYFIETSKQEFCREAYPVGYY